MVLIAERAEADLVLPFLKGFDQQAMSNNFAKLADFLALNGLCEPHPDAGLSTREKAVAGRSVITGAPLSTTKTASMLTTFLVVNTIRNHSTSSFIPLILGTRNEDISSNS